MQLYVFSISRRFMLIVIILIAGSTSYVSAAAASALEDVFTEHAISAEQIDDLIGKDVELLLSNGKRLSGVKLVRFSRGKQKDRVKIVFVQPSGTSRPRRHRAEQVYNLVVEEREYRFSYVPSQKAYALIDMQSRDREIEARLNKQRRRLWKPISPQEQEKHVNEYKMFLEQVGRHFRPLNMQLYETQYFLFFTDIPPRLVAPYLRNLDSMNEQLGQAFGFAPGENIWRGKAVIVAFADRINFLEFERTFMNDDRGGTRQGTCHSYSNGKVIVSCYRGKSTSFFATLLVHETAHGYVHRYKSTMRIPRWLNEGLADWIAGKAVPASTEVFRRQKEAAARLHTVGTLGGRFYSSENLERWQYGVASSLVEILLAQGPDNFRIFFNDIKEGRDWQESLQRAYGITPVELTRHYGRAIGIPNLTP